MTNSKKHQHGGSEMSNLVNFAWNDLSKVWTLPVIHTIGVYQPVRFNELKRRIIGISATSLTERLSELEHRHIVARKVQPETPPRVEYSLTEKGWELHSILCQIAEWAVKWEKGNQLVRELIMERHK
jgi:DNA-binding HxlR family transcriptional regulator